MSAAVIDEQPHHPYARMLGDGRPRARTWPGAVRPSTDQPTLFLGADPPGALGPPQPSRHGVHVVDHPWPARPATVLPDPRSWSASMALAIAETLQGRRPVGQLTRWVNERVLATLTITLRQRNGGHALAGQSRPAVLRSVHLQFPHPDAVEAAAHVRYDARSAAFAFRLETWYDRWLCTALELGPRDQEV